MPPRNGAAPPAKATAVYTAPTGEEFIFIRIPKAAGNSVCRALGVRPGLHVPLSAVCPRKVESLYSFAVCRCPWDRLVSAFFYLCQGGTRNTTDARDRQAVLPYLEDFPRFVRDLADDPEQWFKLQHFRPQLDWVAGKDGGAGVSRMLRAERLDDEFPGVLRLLGMDVPPRFARDNQSVRPTTAEAYTPELAELVGRVYRADVEAFEYAQPRTLAPVITTGKRPWRHPCPTREPAILTACDAGFYPGLLALVVSTRRLAKVPIVCVDLGLTDEQRRDMAARDVWVVPRPATPLDAMLHLAPPSHRHWYPKAFYWDALGPYRRALWLDCDVMVLRDLDKLLAALDEGPVFTVHHQADAHVARNRMAVYDRYPIDNPETAEPINSGVFGLDLDRDAEVIAQWKPLCIAATADPAGLGEMFRCGDQGALWWVVQKMGLAGRVMKDGMRWNYPAHGIPMSKYKALKFYNFDHPEEAIEQVAADHPDAAIVHWGGRPKPWTIQQTPAAAG
jgi:hypothetical protein